MFFTFAFFLQPARGVGGKPDEEGWLAALDMAMQDREEMKRKRLRSV